MSHIPHHEQRLNVQADTSPSDVIDFVESRLREPAEVDGAIIYNFNNHDLATPAIVNAELEQSVYVVPFQVSSTWAFMAEILPTTIAHSSLLTYSVDADEYSVYPNLMAESIDREAVRAALGDVAYEHNPTRRRAEG